MSATLKNPFGPITPPITKTQNNSKMFSRKKTEQEEYYSIKGEDGKLLIIVWEIELEEEYWKTRFPNAKIVQCASQPDAITYIRSSKPSFKTNTCKNGLECPFGTSRCIFVHHDEEKAVLAAHLCNRKLMKESFDKHVEKILNRKLLGNVGTITCIHGDNCFHKHEPTCCLFVHEETKGYWKQVHAKVKQERARRQTLEKIPSPPKPMKDFHLPTDDEFEAFLFGEEDLKKFGEEDLKEKNEIDFS